MKDAKMEDGRAMESCERERGAAAAWRGVSDDTPSPRLKPLRESPPRGEGRQPDLSQQRVVDGNSEVMSVCFMTDWLDY